MNGDTGITAKMGRLDVIIPLMTACAIRYFVYDLHFNLMPVESSLNASGIIPTSMALLVIKIGGKRIWSMKMTALIYLNY